MEKRKRGAHAELIFDSTENGMTSIHIPTMVLAEILYLSEKNRISASLADVFQLIRDIPNFKEFPMDCEVLESAVEITDIPELHDRLVSATAKLLGLELITNDPKMESSAFVKTIW